MPDLPERQPLGDITTTAPRQVPRPRNPALAPRQSAKWARILEDNKNTMGERVQRDYPGIKPARGAMKENDPYSNLETFTIRCGGSRHVAMVHSAVVLRQSPWLRAQVARQVPVRTLEHIRWWQVAWALEYMYEGRVPSFCMLASEEMPAGYPERRSRSIVWGLLELWDAADFFGLEGLQERAEHAFVEYFCAGIRDSILVHRGAIAPGPAEGTSRSATGTSRQQIRFVGEFCLAAWKVSDEVLLHGQEFIDILQSADGWCLSGQPAHDDSLLAWESTMFDPAGEFDDDDFFTENLRFFGPTPRSSAVFRPAIVDMCMHSAPLGLFELKWFQRFVPARGPEWLKVALAQRMTDPDSRWPRDEYPGAPYDFARVDPWRLVASNARPVPGRTAEQDGTMFFS